MPKKSRVYKVRKAHKMTDYININGVIVPIIRIGKGSSRFFTNLAKSYLKNYSIVNVTSTMQCLNLSVWVLYKLKKEYFVSDVRLNWAMDGISLSFNVYNNLKPETIEAVSLVNDARIIKVGQNSDVSALFRVIQQMEECTLIAAGNGCLKLCQLLAMAYTCNFKSSEIGIVKTWDKTGAEKAAMQVYICNFSMLVNNESYCNTVC